MTNSNCNLNDDLSDMFSNGTAERRELPQAPEYQRIRAEVPDFTERCPKCGGSGQFRGWSGRSFGQCFACKGKGSKTFKTSAADRAQAREQRAAQPAKRWDAFKAQHADEAQWIEAKAATFEFAANMRQAVEKYGDLTGDEMGGQRGAVRRCMLRDQQRDQQRQQARQQATANAPQVDASKIVEAMQKGKASGLIWVTLRFNGVVMQEAKKFPGVLYVKHSSRLNAEGQKAYLGKIADGKFIASRECTPEDQAAIILICEDPLAAAKVYGNVTNECCVCGRGLTNKQSVEEGIGPICSSRLGWTPGGLRVQVLSGQED